MPTERVPYEPALTLCGADAVPAWQCPRRTALGSAVVVLAAWPSTKCSPWARRFHCFPGPTAPPALSPPAPPPPQPVWDSQKTVNRCFCKDPTTRYPDCTTTPIGGITAAAAMPPGGSLRCPWGCCDHRLSVRVASSVRMGAHTCADNTPPKGWSGIPGPNTQAPALSTPTEPAGACGEGCLNGGTCDAPPACTCPDGFLGPRCEALATREAAAMQVPQPEQQPQPQPQRERIVVEPAPLPAPQPTAAPLKAAAAPALPPPADDTAKALVALRAWRQRSKARQARAESAVRSPASAHLASSGKATAAGASLTPEDKWSKLMDLMDKACDDYYSFAIIKSERPTQVRAAGVARATGRGPPRRRRAHEPRGQLSQRPPPPNRMPLTPAPFKTPPGAAPGDVSGNEVMSSALALTPPKIYVRYYCEGW